MDQYVAVHTITGITDVVANFLKFILQQSNFIVFM